MKVRTRRFHAHRAADRRGDHRYHRAIAVPDFSAPACRVTNRPPSVRSAPSTRRSELLVSSRPGRLCDDAARPRRRVPRKPAGLHLPRPRRSRASEPRRQERIQRAPRPVGDGRSGSRGLQRHGDADQLLCDVASRDRRHDRQPRLLEQRGRHDLLRPDGRCADRSADGACRRRHADSIASSSISSYKRGMPTRHPSFLFDGRPESMFSPLERAGTIRGSPSSSCSSSCDCRILASSRWLNLSARVRAGETHAAATLQALNQPICIRAGVRQSAVRALSREPRDADAIYRQPFVTRILAWIRW